MRADENHPLEFVLALTLPSSLFLARALDLTNPDTRQLFLMAAADQTGQYHAHAVPKKKGFLRRDDGLRDLQAPDQFDFVNESQLECAFLTTLGAETTPYVTHGVVLDTRKVDASLCGGDKDKCPKVAVSAAPCGTLMLDWTASTRAVDTLQVTCPRGVVDSVVCEAVGTEASVKVAKLAPLARVQSLDVTADTVFTCAIACREEMASE